MKHSWADFEWVQYWHYGLADNSASDSGKQPNDKQQHDFTTKQKVVEQPQVEAIKTQKRGQNGKRTEENVKPPLVKKRLPFDGRAKLKAYQYQREQQQVQHPVPKMQWNHYASLHVVLRLILKEYSS